MMVGLPRERRQYHAGDSEFIKNPRQSVFGDAHLASPPKNDEVKLTVDSTRDIAYRGCTIKELNGQTIHKEETLRFNAGEAEG